MPDSHQVGDTVLVPPLDPTWLGQPYAVEITRIDATHFSYRSVDGLATGTRKLSSIITEDPCPK